MTASIQLDATGQSPLYRQLHRQIRRLILDGQLRPGERLPATRELAQDLSVNRATVSSAYALLEEEGLIHGHVGRGSFVCDHPTTATRAPIFSTAAAPAVWSRSPNTGAPDFSARDTDPASGLSSATLGADISFATSRPLAGNFPLEDFRESCQEVLSDEIAQTVLQLGSPLGYAPLRQYLMEDAEVRQIGRANDDILITNGCQQAIDLLARALLSPGDTVVVEEPVYPGLKAALQQSGARLVGVPVTQQGVDVETFDRTIERERPRMAVLTPSFQNPTGACIPLEARRDLLLSAQRHNVLLVENDLYSELRYRGESLAPIKSLAEADEVNTGNFSVGGTVLLGSFSKVAFPGLRVGWVVANRDLIRRMAEIKQATDLHTDQLSQAVLLRFAESGRLASHLQRARITGLAQLEAAVASCRRYLPAGSTFTIPDGGLNLWVRLPETLDAHSLLPAAQMRGVSYLPARYFAVNRTEPQAFRLSFGGLTPAEIEMGIRILGEVFDEELERRALAGSAALETAMV
jgi:2-aminoadipate transaminase